MKRLTFIFLSPFLFFFFFFLFVYFRLFRLAEWTFVFLLSWFLIYPLLGFYVAAKIDQRREMEDAHDERDHPQL